MTEKEYLIDCIRRIQLDYQKQIDPYIKRLASLYEPQSYIVGVTRFNGAIPDELQPDKTVHYTAVTPEDVIHIQEVASEALGLLKQRFNQKQGD